MENRIACVLVHSSAGPLFSLALDWMLPPGPYRIPRWVRAGFWTLLFFLSSAGKRLIGLPSAACSIFNIVLLILCIGISTRFFYTGNLWVRIGVELALNLALMTAELAAWPVCLLLHTKTLSMDFSQPDMVAGCLTGSLFSHTAMYLTALLWHRLGMKQRPPRGCWLCGVVPVLLMVPSLQYYLAIVAQGGRLPPIHLVSLLAAYALSLLFICLQFRQAEKDRLEQQLRELRQRIRLEQRYYRQVEAHQQSLAKLRHDYTNQLCAIAGLLQMGSTREAAQTIDALLHRVSQTGQGDFCGIPIVNAIVSEKDAICRGSGIRLQVQLLLPENMTIAPLDLCSLFSNLLDNAIRACQQLPEAERQIRLTAGVQGDYLTVRCDNPCPRTPVPGGSGLGLQILEDKVRLYGGSLQAGKVDGQYIARAVLLCRSSVDSDDKTVNFADRT